VHISIPIIVALISVYLVIGPIVDDPKLEYVYAMAFIAAGAVVYVPFVRYRYVLPGMGENNEKKKNPSTPLIPPINRR
jgi:L-type amino acid transporter 9